MIAALLVAALLPLPPASAGPRFYKVGDMLLSEEQHRGLIREGEDSVVIAPVTGFGDAGTRPWPGGVLPVSFAGGFTKAERSLFLEACRVWSKRAPVRCAARGGERDAVVLVRNQGCSSVVGHLPGAGAHPLSLGPGCWDLPVILHELGHAFGLMHEHQRKDRDRYITVLWSNIAPGGESSYYRIAQDPQGIPYDFLSIMHYWSGAFGRQGLPTFALKPQYRKLAGRVGHAKLPSRGDALSLRKAYRPRKPAPDPDVQVVTIPSVEGRP